MDQLARAVVLRHESVGHIADRGSIRDPAPSHDQEELVLRGGEPLRDRLLLAPGQEATELGAELEESLVVSFG